MSEIVKFFGKGIGMGIFSALFLFAFHSTVQAADIACTGSTTGAAGTCTTLVACEGGTVETPVNTGNGTFVSLTCPQDWICCIPASDGTGSDKPPKTIDPLPPADPTDPGNNPGTANQGDPCMVATGSGQCEFTDQCSPANSVAAASCTGGTICCLTSGVGLGSGTCTGTCHPTCETNETRDRSQTCTDTATPQCCKVGTSGGPGTTGTGVTGSQCTGEVIGGVCFPTGTGLSDKSVGDIIGALIGWLLSIFGFIALIGFIISGLQYLTAAGDEGQAETAKRNMQYSIIGIIVALSGWIIIKAVDALLNANSWI
ncbi:MAG: hypothetical protein E6P95_00990 [Candidatus Moraniibacteriota bacterium]|nr:MAG: hypothetical protein E6P95_00990 [Candidatus Moranbacteria bacterium]